MSAIAALALFLPKPQYILFGAAFSKLVYMTMNFRAQIRLYGKVHLLRSNHGVIKNKLNHR